MPATGSRYFTQPEHWHRKILPLYACAGDMQALWEILHYEKYRTVECKKQMKWNLNVCTPSKHNTKGEVERKREHCCPQWFFLRGTRQPTEEKEIMVD